MESRQNEASFSLAKHVIDHAKHQNLIFSPLSIHVILGMAAAGSNGPTRDQILGFLKSNSLEELHAHFSWIMNSVLVDASPFGGPVLSCANGIWIDQTLHFKPAYQDLVRNSYRAATQCVDFQNKANEVREEVNAWGEKETNGTIKEILSPDSVEASRFIFANAVYFKGTWDQNFNARDTKEREFYLLDGGSVRAPFMKSVKYQYFRACDGFKLLKMPYKQSEHKRIFSLYMFLPDANDGLPALADRVCSDSGFINKHYPHDETPLHEFRIPKFVIDFRLDATSLLKKVGLELLFGDGVLTEMVDSCLPLDGSKMYQNSFIKLNEEGTKYTNLKKRIGLNSLQSLYL